MHIEDEINLVDMAKDIAQIKLAVLGNGQKGLCQRVEELEEQNAKQGWLIGICSGIGAVFGAVVTHFLNIFKG